MDQLVIDFFVWLIPHGKIHPGLLIHDALLMRESLIAFSAMIAAHTAFADSAKRHITGSQMNDNVIDAAATERTGLDDFVCSLLTICKDV